MINNKINEPIGKYISQLYRKGNSFINKELSQYGIGSGQSMFLTQLYMQEGISQEELSEKLHIDKATTARAIKRLEDGEFLIRLKDEQDNRAYKIYLTDKSNEMKMNIYEVLYEWEQRISKNITQEEKDTLLLILKKICSDENVK